MQENQIQLDLEPLIILIGKKQTIFLRWKSWQTMAWCQPSISAKMILSGPLFHAFRQMLNLKSDAEHQSLLVFMLQLTKEIQINRLSMILGNLGQMKN